MTGASLGQTQVLHKALTSATHAGAEMMLDAVTKSVAAMKQAFAEAALDPTPRPPAVVIAETFATVEGLLADIRTEHAKSK